jgi:serine protease Do
MKETIIKLRMTLNQFVKVRRWAAAAISVTILALGTVAGLVASANNPESSSAATPLFVESSGEPLSDQISFQSGFASVVKPALAAVVNISSSKTTRVETPFFGSPFFRDFFGDRFGERREQGVGSGVIINSDGYILTNHHVIDGASDVRVYLRDKREIKARVIGADPRTDIAVLKIDESNLSALPLGDSSLVQVGEFVLAIGNPFGVGQTVTFGIVSATGRGGLNIEDYEDFIQTDAAINPGNSGGALINARGQLIGINTAIVSRGAGGNQGVGFAVPVNMARYVMEQILKNGKVVRGYLGVIIQEVTPSLAKAFGLNEPRGALVSDVTPGGPASRAGIVKGEIITEINGERVVDSRSLRVRIAQTAPGTAVRLKLLNEGREREVSLTLGELPETIARGEAGVGIKGAMEGVSLDEMNAQVARQLGLPASLRGVVVTDIRPDTPAADAGLRRGDVIVEVNRRSVSSLAEFEGAAAGKQSLLLLVRRGENTVYVAIESR